MSDIWNKITCSLNVRFDPFRGRVACAGLGPEFHSGVRRFDPIRGRVARVDLFCIEMIICTMENLPSFCLLLS